MIYMIKGGMCSFIKEKHVNFVFSFHLESLGTFPIDQTPTQTETQFGNKGTTVTYHL